LSFKECSPLLYNISVTINSGKNDFFSQSQELNSKQMKKQLLLKGGFYHDGRFATLMDVVIITTISKNQL